jgi:hypothetical protein
MEHDAQPYQGDQHQLGEKEIGYHGKTPHTGGEMRVFDPVCHVAGLAAGCSYTTVHSIKTRSTALKHLPQTALAS